MTLADDAAVSGAQSVNFGFLLPKFPFLEAIAGWAEQYAHHDPAACLNKARQFAEGVLKEANERRYRVPCDPTAEFATIIKVVAVPRLPWEITTKLRLVKDLGNMASHYDIAQAGLTSQKAVDAVRECHALARFFGDQALDLEVPKTQFRAPKKGQAPRLLMRELDRLAEENERLRAESGRLPKAGAAPDAAALRASGEAAVGRLKIEGKRAAAMLAELAPVALAKSYREAKVRLGADEQGALDAFEQAVLASESALACERIPGATDAKLAWASAGPLRVVYLAPEEADLRVLLWAGVEADARAWAKQRSFEVHPKTGALQEVLHVEPTAASPASRGRKALLGHVPPDDLLTLGVPTVLLKAVGAATDEVMLRHLFDALPEEATESLMRLLTGDPMEAVLAEARARVPVGAAAGRSLELALAHPDARRRFFVAPTKDALEEALAQPLDAWRLFLHPSQGDLVGKRFNGPARTLGGAGTGKTVVAMHRAKILAQRHGEGGKILFTSFSRNLAENLRRQVQVLCGDLAERVEVNNLDSVAASLARRELGADLNIAGNAEVRQAWEAVIRSVGDAGRSRGFLESELAWSHEQLGAITKDDYLKAKRKGRGRLSRAQLLEVWKVLAAFREALGGRPLWSDVHRLARKHVERTGPPYRCVVVDEAQDLSGEQLRLVRSLAAEAQDDLFLVGDAHQRIWRDAIAFKACGIHIVGRSRKLTLNYRTTEAIRRFAVQAVAAAKVDDMDEGDDSAEGCVSLRAGDPPTTQGFTSAAEETAFVVARITELLAKRASPAEICVLARENRALSPITKALKAQGIGVRRLEAMDDATDEGDGVRLSSLHRAKGLEFVHVFLVHAGEDQIPPKGLLDGMDEEQRAAMLLHERSLLYVAGTRPRQTLTITWTGTPTPLLDIGGGG